MIALNIGIAVLGISAIILVIGIFVVLWDWSVNSDPDAPHGGPIVVIAVVGLLCGGVVSCMGTISVTLETKAQQGRQE